MASTIPGNRIYHYCKLKTALDHILPKQQLRLNPLKNTNDPRENASFVFGFISWKQIPHTEIQNKEFSEILRNDCKLICFSKDHKFLGCESSRMWAYYGENHTGLCLELDKEEFLKENAGVIDPTLLRDITYYEYDYKWTGHRKVDYTIADDTGMEKYLKEIFRIEHLEYLYFTKNKEWESEQEARLIHFSNNTGDEYCSIKKSLRNIFCGVDFNLSSLPQLVKLCPQTDISLLEYKDVRLNGKVIYSGNEKYIHPEFKAHLHGLNF